jgi:radical SAM superfamily enzyme YgiQ (UPF0313 family)
MKALLINPPFKSVIMTNTPSIVDEEQGFFPPLGIMYIASYAENKTEHKIEILDTQVEQLNYTQIEYEIKKRGPDIVGITTMTFSLIDSILTAKVVKKVDDSIAVVLGGPHVGIYPEETINFSEVDYLVIGEGEITFTELLQNIDDKDKLKNVEGLVFKDNGNIVKTESREFIKDLDALPFPARHLTPYEKYCSLLAKESIVTTMITSRGCPYKCIFCNRPHLGKKFRARSAINVVNEMEECVKKGINEIAVYDDTFTLNRQRAIDVCNEILGRDLEIRWDIRTRVDTVDKELLSKLKEAGCDRIHYGIEAGTPEILKVLKKGITLEQARNAIKWSKEIGISTLAYFMIGSPGESREQINETINFAKKLNSDFAHFSITTPFPATELCTMGVEKGIIKNDCWRDFAKNPSVEFQSPYWEENLSRDELIELLNFAYKRFYIRPKYILRSISKVRSFDEFRKKAKAGLKVVKM